MAAKPPKPPGNFLKSLLNQHNNNKNQQQLQQQHDNEDDDIESNDIEKLSIDAATTINPIDNNNTTSTSKSSSSSSIASTKKSNCNCSNISIMHLFHEMKQEFPTLPDTIVAQCVNENCHQRENCIQMLRNEFELNPIPAQSYPAKVLHPPNNNNNNNLQNSTNNNINNNTTTTTNTNNIIPTTNSLHKPPLQQKPINVQQKPPLKPIKPIRTAPLQPPTPLQQQCNNNNNNYNNNNNNNSMKTNTIISKNTKTNKPLVGGENISNSDCGNNVGNIDGYNGGGGGGGAPPQHKQSISTTSNVNTTTLNEVNNNVSEICTSVGNADCMGAVENIERNLPRQRPTTLNLNTQLQKQQQQQRQRLNVQLQQRFQEQRNRQQQQQSHTNTNISRPLRKAPLPPIAPKPTQFQINNNLNNSLSSNNSTTSPLSESEISVSVSLSTPSPTSPNNPIHHNHQYTPTAITNQQHQTHLQTKSPIRHRSVITLQPEPPYTRDFLYTPASLTSTPTSPSLAAPPSAGATAVGTTTIQTTSSSSATSSPTASVAGSQKSFTSVNLTLRPPVSPTGPNSALQPSTIDITAGPGFSGASGGGKSLHYSSTSYDARLGYQQNFQITVTDEGGVFRACRIRPQQQQQLQRQHCLNQVNINNDNQYDGNSGNETITNQNNYINSFLNIEKQQQQQQHHHQQQQQQQFHNNNVVALQQNIQNSIQSPNGIGTVNTSSGFGGSGVYSGGNMCLPPQTQAMNDPNEEILQRQKKKRDKLAAALREYKKRLGNVEQEINLLTGSVPTEGLSERLDEEIRKLRRDCQDIVRSSSTFSQPPPLQQELAINYQPNQLQQQPQPFPRQRLTRPPPRPPPPRQTSLDIIQHHSQSSTPHTPPAASLPNLNYNSPQQHHSPNSMSSPSYYHQQSAPPLPSRNTNSGINHNMYMDSPYNDDDDDDEPLVDDVDDYEDEYEEVLEPWECNMCTFRNHPQLNICETCENVRIIPGRLSNLPRTLSANNFTNLTGGGLAQPPPASGSASGISPTLGLLRGSNGSSNALNNSNSSSRNGLNNTANGNLEHDTNLAQQQLQHFALHT
ncbi:TAK1-associated binding protein 2 isoform 2-T3 [Cochliomyia hominivorax]